MEITLLHHTPIEIIDKAIGTCWDKQKECVDFDRMYRVGNKYKHSSTLEHVSYNFRIKDVSRALLHELVRHRIASFSVKSTRYTLKELKDEEPFVMHPFSTIDKVDYERAKHYLVMTGDDEIDVASIHGLESVRRLIVKNKPNDKVKYPLPEAYKTDLIFTINMRSLQNFIKLRSDKSALWEIRILAQALFTNLPDDHKFMLEEFLYMEE